MNRENASSIETRLALTPAARTATVADAPIIDMRGYDSATFVVFAGAVTAADADNRMNFTLSEGDASNLSDGDAVAAGDFVGAPVVDATADADSIIGTIVYKGSKRYVRLVGTETGTFNAIVGAVVNLSHADHQPV